MRTNRVSLETWPPKLRFFAQISGCGKMWVWCKRPLRTARRRKTPTVVGDSLSRNFCSYPRGTKLNPAGVCRHIVVLFFSFAEKNPKNMLILQRRSLSRERSYRIRLWIFRWIKRKVAMKVRRYRVPLFRLSFFVSGLTKQNGDGQVHGFIAPLDRASWTSHFV